MSVKIRLAKRGRKKLAMYDIVVANSKSPRDGKFIEKLGTYNPNTNPIAVVVNEDKAFDWIMKGAQPSDTVRMILSNLGVMFKKHLQIGVIKGAVTQEQADQKLAAWKSDKAAKDAKNLSDSQQKKSADKKAKFQAESEVNKKREEAIKAKKVAQVIEAPVAESTEATTEETKAE